MSNKTAWFLTCMPGSGYGDIARLESGELVQLVGSAADPSLIRHRQLRPLSGVDPKAEPQGCAKCGRTFWTPAYLAEHQRRNHAQAAAA